MIFLNFYGSSHISERHGLQTAIKAGFQKMDDVFKTKFEIKTLDGMPGATYYNNEVLDGFVQNSSKLTTDSDYKCQINVVILGKKHA